MRRVSVLVFGLLLVMLGCGDGKKAKAQNDDAAAVEALVFDAAPPPPPIDAGPVDIEIPVLQ